MELPIARLVNAALDRATDAPLPLGARAPDFSLPDQAGRVVTLSGLRGGGLVLVFYPRDNTPVCSMQLRDFNAEAAALSALGARVFGINSGAAATHARFCEKLGLGFDLLVDDGARVAQAYHATIGPAGPLRQVRRTVYALDAEGRVVFAERGTPSPASVLAALRP